MKARIIASVFTIMIVLCSFVPSVHGDMTDDQWMAFYSKYVDKYIEVCEQKDFNYSASCIINIEKYGAINCLKAAYVGFYKEILVLGLMANREKIGKSDYKIDHFINSNFFKVFKAAKQEKRYEDI